MIDSIATTIATTFCNGPTINPEPQQPQRTWVGLTDEEVHALWMTGEANINEEHHSVIAYEVEAKLKEKNT